ncbi:PQQ-binding-like beta-propeller repeat protein [Nigerium sp.]|uniref:outer membrane protein assembly factor BamB family protein n=1 Tax=Nigerium sp. TaxID=2042655 RepID=UPI003221F2B9
MPRRPRRPRRMAALAVAGALGLSLAACTATVREGPRPNKPTAVATRPAYRATDPAKLTIAPETLPGFRPPTVQGPGSYSKMLTGPMGNMSWLEYHGGDINWQIYDQNNKPLPNYSPTEKTAFGPGQDYTNVQGVLTFRGNNERNAPAFGTAEVKEKKLEMVWSHDDGISHSYGSVFPGTGWTGQPLLVHWPDATRRAMDFAPEFANDPNFVEVIQPAFDGKVYRLDLATGRPTKPPIDATYGFKGTGSIDPRGYPLLYAGQGLNDQNGVLGPWGYKMFDLIQNKMVHALNGTDPVSHRPFWGAWDSSALVNAASDTLIEPGENGVIYKVKLNSHFDAAAKRITIDPQVTKMVYQSPASTQYGIESSAAAYRNLMYASDNDGHIICWDANTLQVVWAQTQGDNDDSTITIDETPEGVYLYNANSVGWRGGKRHDLVSNIRKIDALSGQVLWQHDVPAYYNDAVKGGVESTPLNGQGEIADLVIFTVAKTTSPAEGDMIALDKKTGKVVWDRHLDRYSWSSPVQITGTDGKAYGVFGDSGGTFHLFDPNTGRDLDTVHLGGNVEASAAVYGNMIVIGSYGQKIFGIKIS